MSATEDVIEQIPEAVLEDTAEVITIVRNNPILLLGVAIAAGSAGAFVGYKLSQRRWKYHYEDIANQEIAEAKTYYARLRLKGDPEELLQELHGERLSAAVKATMRYSGEDAETPAESEDELSPEESALFEKNGVPTEFEAEEGPDTREAFKETRKSVFERSRPVSNDDFDFEAEILNRTGERPYVITHDEFYENEKDYEQIHLAYFQGDDTLVDERDQPVPDEDASVGNDNLTKFGYGSKDENIVFVRNEVLEADFEITRSMGKYAEEVLGLDTESGLKHSNGRGNRKFRLHQED